MDATALQSAARAHHVRRLELFGSAARGGAPNDYDFLVVFDPLPPLEHGRAYLALLTELQHILGKPVDLLELEALRNPYFLQSIQSDRTLIYGA